MIRRAVLALVVSCLALACGSSGAKSPATDAPADIVIFGDVRTMVPDSPRADAIAVRDGVIIYVGDASGARALVGKDTRVVDAAGRTVLPGFQDAHVHAVTGDISLGECVLNEERTQEAILEKIRLCAEEKPDAPWIVGRGWELPIFPDANPSKALLDAVIPDRPAYFRGADGHSGWANSKALEIAGITKDTKDPATGRIERDADGNPSGTLREDAMSLIESKRPPRTKEDYIAGLRRGMAMANRLGITSLYDASASPDVLAAYTYLRDQGELTLRVRVAQDIDYDRGAGQIDAIAKRADDASKGLVSAHAIKIYVDGVIEAKTAAMLEPYTGTKTRGVMNLPIDRLDEIVVAADARGLDIHMHAIGDHAIRAGLDAIAAAIEKNGPRDRRPTIAHLQVIDPADIPRFKKLGVAANFQPLWAQNDDYIIDLTIPFLGPERSRWLYPIASVMATGASVVLGSDWIVSSMDPLEGIEVGVTRRGIGDEREPLVAQESVPAEKLVHAYTAAVAPLLRLENTSGQLRVGLRGDVIVLTGDVFAAKPREIHDLDVEMTLFDGKVVYQAPAPRDKTPTPVSSLDRTHHEHK